MEGGYTLKAGRLHQTHKTIAASTKAAMEVRTRMEVISSKPRWSRPQTNETPIMARKAISTLGKNAGSPTGLMATGAVAAKSAPQRGQAPAFSGNSPAHLQHSARSLGFEDPSARSGFSLRPSNSGGEPGAVGCESGSGNGFDNPHAPSRMLFNPPRQALPNPDQLRFWLTRFPFGTQWRPERLWPSK